MKVIQKGFHLETNTDVDVRPALMRSTIESKRESPELTRAIINDLQTFRTHDASTVGINGVTAATEHGDSTLFSRVLHQAIHHAKQCSTSNDGNGKIEVPGSIVLSDILNVRKYPVCRNVLRFSMLNEREQS